MSKLAQKLDDKLKGPVTIVLSIDDFYLTRQQQSELAAKHPKNPLIQHRGQPSTHDLPLALSVLSDLCQGNTVKIPSYDKSACQGQGDRSPEEGWKVGNEDGKPSIAVVILEGWCVGFRALAVDEVKRKWEIAVADRNAGHYDGRLGWNRLEDVEFINNALMDYDEITDRLDALIHLDAEDERFVYSWRQEQEEKLRGSKGSGMSDTEVRSFISGYYPAYELFTDQLRGGTIDGKEGRQLRLVIGRQREMTAIHRI